uniref:ATP synthase complex subunit 8 n=1 Tax=Cryptotermes chacoensis TaxID=2942686 RepID=A0A8X8RGR1_9NEOP|nr:ATP synthase F0 subunit 8 [Cryptotermes chacoensis]
MPQMMPLSWLSLFIMFSITMITFAVTNYYVTNMETKTTIKNKILSKTVNWKW